LYPQEQRAFIPIGNDNFRVHILGFASQRSLYRGRLRKARS